MCLYEVRATRLRVSGAAAMVARMTTDTPGPVTESDESPVLTLAMLRARLEDY